MIFTIKFIFKMPKNSLFLIFFRIFLNKDYYSFSNKPIFYKEINDFNEES